MRNLVVFHVFIGLQKCLKSGATFMIAGEKCINKQLDKHVASAFKLC